MHQYALESAGRGLVLFCFLDVYQLSAPLHRHRRNSAFGDRGSGRGGSGPRKGMTEFV